MNWDETTAGRSKTLSAITEAADLSELARPLEEWLTRLIEQLNALPNSYEWNRVSMELWLDSGRLIGYPALGSYEISQWPFSIELEIPFLIAAFEEAAVNDEEEQTISALEYRVWLAMRQAFRNSAVKRLLNDLRKSKVFTIWRQSGGDLSTANQFFI